MTTDITPELLTQLLTGARKASSLSQDADHHVTRAIARAIAFAFGLPQDEGVLLPMRKAIGREAPEAQCARDALAAVAIAEACERNALDPVTVARVVPGGKVRVIAVGSHFPGEQHVLLDCGNGFGLSVMRNSGPQGESYGGKDGLWEALPGYVTPAGLSVALGGHYLRAHFGWRDARGWLTAGDVEGLAREVAAMPRRDYPVPEPDQEPAPGSPRVPGCSCGHCDTGGELT